ncbi:MAG: N-acetylglucosamine-6-phosphate deacetylase [Alphaproteobacteria bacterium]|nr:N-acetylglucosamine-6-phosphate deacetylase [Alphaproteobacteria bacterium]MBU1550291.1 N-acetylglucosamine-6-phosphate deacetylase [Alphaproteobacteria bacterium]MBU2337788.1 N-acetylglucosamine-6-phosphate deacetylase [Alphaproteobacteria bacterium]MBU2387768.1 N-acetylglucosamine-6-phosphate deacetylase [Alphaproteobacteria bacterium]
MTLSAIRGARIFDGETWHEDAALVVSGGRVTAIVAEAEIPADAELVSSGGGILVPGFVDLQVNGGGGVMLNDQPTVEGLRTICRAQARFGTTALLPTLITDTPETTAAVIAAGRQAVAQNMPGFAGLHLEGPHLSLARKGAHDPALIRPMDAADLDLLLSCRDVFPAMMITVAPENVTEEQVSRLAAAGFVLSLGHTDAGFDTVERYAKAGASTVTHLFNAMSPLGHREPGMVGAALDNGHLHAGLIADGIHVHPAAMSLALRAKQGPGRIFVVTDAMSPIGTDLTSFTLNGREILRRDGRLTLADGTLAGADIDMLASVHFLHRTLALPLEEALRMVSAYPAEAARLGQRKGALKPGYDADFVLLTDDLQMKGTWIGGAVAHRA